jgi:antibiotic biosynthesis monooxygenase (ABM) superfamily enzyme
MTTISKENKIVTLINVFTCKPENQQRLVDLLSEATKQEMRHLPGFISENIHKSSDGVRVATYAQWQRQEDFEAMMRNPKALPLRNALKDIGTLDAHQYEVVENYNS